MTRQYQRTNLSQYKITLFPLALRSIVGVIFEMIFFEPRNPGLDAYQTFFHFQIVVFEFDENEKENILTYSLV